MPGTYKTTGAWSRQSQGMTNSPAPVNLSDKLSQFRELWSQKKIADVNDYEVKLAKLKGEFVWHRHDDTDELFLVLSGRLNGSVVCDRLFLNGDGRLAATP